MAVDKIEIVDRKHIERFFVASGIAYALKELDKLSDTATIEDAELLLKDTLYNANCKVRILDMTLAAKHGFDINKNILRVRVDRANGQLYLFIEPKEGATNSEEEV